METTKSRHQSQGDATSKSVRSLYPTEREEQEYRELKEKYGLRDSAVVTGQAGAVEDDALQSVKQQ